MTVPRVAVAALVVLLAIVGVQRVVGDDAECREIPSQDDGPAWPAGCWRPYADDSPFNRPIPDDPRLDPRSDDIVRTITAAGPGKLDAGMHDTENDYGRPVYFSRPDDPEFRVRCTRSWGRCPFEGLSIRMPDDARPAAGRDGHLTVVDPRSGEEYDMWKVARKPRGGGEITTAWGGRTRIDGNGLGSEAVAAHFGTLAGLIRPEELEAGRIRHALFMTVPCVARVDGRDHVYPALGRGRRCPDDRAAPLLGARVQLDMSEEEIDRLDVPPWTRTLLHAMAEYGMFVGDTGGPPGWALQSQSDTTYTSLGRKPRLFAFARKAGWLAREDPATGKPAYVGDFSRAVDWRSRLRVVDPCVSSRSCG